MSTAADLTVREMFESCLGCKWTLHVLDRVRHGVRRPGELERTADGLTTKVLNERLVKLVAFGLLKKQSFAEIPPRVEYQLTDFGGQFVAVLDQIEVLQREHGSSVPNGRIG